MTNSKILLFLISLCLFVKVALQGNEIPGGIRNLQAHLQNRALCVRLVENFCQTFPSHYSPQQKAESLSRNLGALAAKLLNQGFDLNAYAWNPPVEFSIVPLWQGAHDSQSEIPLTLLIYVWPPEAFAKQYAKTQGLPDRNYATVIHGHPIPCAMTVLKGTLHQENFTAVAGWPFQVAQKKGEEILRPGKVEFDDNSSEFIHRLVCRDPGCEPALSLHGYGASSAEEVHRIFRATFQKFTYRYVLKENGKLYENY